MGGISTVMFKTFIKKYRDEDSNSGDFARDIAGDKSFPKNGIGKFNGWKNIILDYLKHKGACQECLETFEGLWREYENDERRRLKRPLMTDVRKTH